MRFFRGNMKKRTDKCISLAAAVLFICCVLLLCACTPGGATENITHDVTTPFIQQGTVIDPVRGRFIQVNEVIYFAASDSIQFYNTKTGEYGLAAIADTPCELSFYGGKIIYRSVSARENYEPSEYAVRSLDISSGETAVIAAGEISFAACGAAGVFYISGNRLLCVKDGASSMLFEGELVSPQFCGGNVVLGMDGDICILDTDSGNVKTIGPKCYPQELVGAQDFVLYAATEDSGAVKYPIQGGESERLPFEIWGISTYNENCYRLVNENGFRLVNAQDGKSIAELGALQSCSYPFYGEQWIYFLVGSDDYFGLIRVSWDGKTTEQLLQAQG